MRVGDTGDMRSAYPARHAAARSPADAADTDTLDLSALATNRGGQGPTGPLRGLRAMRLSQPSTPSLWRPSPPGGKDGVQYKAAVSDLDGTVVNSAPLHAEAWCIFFREYFDILLDPDEPNHFHGSDAEIVVRVVADKLDRDLTGDEMQLYPKKTEIFGELVRKRGVDPMPGAPEFFRHVATRGPLALVTNSGSESADMMLHRSGAQDLFKLRVTGDDVERKKPAPDGYLRAADLLGVSPEELVAFEDTPGGEEAALAAGIREIYILGETVPRHRFPEADHDRVFGIDYHELSQKLGIPEAELRQHRIRRL